MCIRFQLCADLKVKLEVNAAIPQSGPHNKQAFIILPSLTLAGGSLGRAGMSMREHTKDFHGRLALEQQPVDLAADKLTPSIDHRQLTKPILIGGN